MPSCTSRRSDLSQSKSLLQDINECPLMRNQLLAGKAVSNAWEMKGRKQTEKRVQSDFEVQQKQYWRYQRELLFHNLLFSCNFYNYMVTKFASDNTESLFKSKYELNNVPCKSAEDMFKCLLLCHFDSSSASPLFIPCPLISNFCTHLWYSKRGLVGKAGEKTKGVLHV